MFQEDEPTNPARYFLEQHITNDARRAYERGVQTWVMFGPTADTMNEDFTSAQSILTAITYLFYFKFKDIQKFRNLNYKN